MLFEFDLKRPSIGFKGVQFVYNILYKKDEISFQVLQDYGRINVMKLQNIFEVILLQIYSIYEYANIILYMMKPQNHSCPQIFTNRDSTANIIKHIYNYTHI